SAVSRIWRNWRRYRTGGCTEDSSVKASAGRPGQRSPSVSAQGVAGPSGVHRSSRGAQGVCQVICYPQNKGKNILALVGLQSDLSNPSQSPDGKFSREQLEHHLLTSTG